MDSLIDYSRQAEFDRVLSVMNKDHENCIIGCGGVGFWLGMLLAMHGHTKFTLVDGQCIAKSNLNRLPVPPTWVGVNKAIALRKVIRTVRPLTAITVLKEHITEDFMSVVTHHNNNLVKVIWDCTDDGRIQKKLFKAIRDIGSPSFRYRKLGYEGFNVGSYKAYDVWIPEDYAPGYRTSNACASTSALAAVLGIMTQGLGVAADREINIADIARGE